jgi:glycosyltransferase involved in cell wall biosynthesis
MKILLAANTDWYLYNFRMSLGKFLRDKGCQVIFVSPSGPYSSRFAQLEFQWIPWGLGRKSVSPISELRALNHLITIYRLQQPDVVHHFTMKPVLYGTLAARAANVPGIINCVTGLGYVWSSGDLKARALRPLLKTLFRMSLNNPKTRVVFENPGDQLFFIREGIVNETNAHIIPGVGVDVKKFEYLPEKDGMPLVVFPARILWDKGVGVLVEAVKLLSTRIKVRVALVGRPDPGNPTSVEENLIDQWQAEGLVEYWGWKDDMIPVYQQCHIVALPSFYEGVPTALLEAAASGRPIVATDIPGCREVVLDGVNGYLVSVNDPKALADALEKLLQDAELRRQMGLAGRQLILDKFTDQSVNERTWKVYETLR